VMPDIIDLTINDNASNISATFCLWKNQRKASLSSSNTTAAESAIGFARYLSFSVAEHGENYLA
jgi:hypothetical protein